MRLEDITTGGVVAGISPQGPVTILTVDALSEDAASVVYAGADGRPPDNCPHAGGSNALGWVSNKPAGKWGKWARSEQMTPGMVFRDPYMLDFLDLTDGYSERDLEAAILRDMERFLLELGIGFTFVARQKPPQCGP